MLKLIGTQLFDAPAWATSGDRCQVVNSHNEIICAFDIIATSNLEGFQAWEDEYGRGYISVLDGFRVCPYNDGPYYQLSVSWKHVIGAFPTISMEERGTEIDVFVYPMRDEAWSTP
jgi:hypothetical protein